MEALKHLIKLYIFIKNNIPQVCSFVGHHF